MYGSRKCDGEPSSANEPMNRQIDITGMLAKTEMDELAMVRHEGQHNVQMSETLELLSLTYTQPSQAFTAI
jgi:hypothetical protein